MKDYLEGWINAKQAHFPPVRQNGFSENMIIREYIPPKCAQRSIERDIKKDIELDKAEKKESVPSPDVSPEEPDTELIEPSLEPEGYKGEEPTVLVNLDKICAYVKRKKTGEVIEITKDGFVIGKSKEADYVIAGNSTVSRQHVKIHTRENEYWLEDLNSANHTYIDGEQITKPIRLIDEMQFCLSNDEEFEFMIRVG